MRNLKVLALSIVLSACASTLDYDGALAVAPYHLVKDGRIVVEAYVNGKGPFDFALDTASSITIVFEDLRKRLELEPIPGTSAIVHSIASSGQFPVHRVNRFQVGDEIWVNARVVSLPGETEAVTEIDGVLGVDFLRRYAIGFSTKEGLVRLYAPHLVREKSYRGWVSIPLEPVHIRDVGAALYFFDIEFGPLTMPALFDLGSGANIMNWPGARSLGVTPKDLSKRHAVSGALGTAPIAAQIEVNELTTRGIRWRNEIFAVADFEIFTTLQYDESPLAISGSGLFNQRDFVIDFVGNRLLVKSTMGEVDPSRQESEKSPVRE